jgi:hypothetical protein
MGRWWRWLAAAIYAALLAWAHLGSFGRTATTYLEALGLRSIAGVLGWLAAGLALGRFVIWLRAPGRGATPARPARDGGEPERLAQLRRELETIEMDRERRTHRHLGDPKAPV